MANAKNTTPATPATPADNAPATPPADTTTPADQAPPAAPPAPDGSLDWNTPPADAAADEAADEQPAEVVVDFNLPIAVDAYVIGLEAELEMFGEDPERKAAIVAELDAVRGGRAVNPPKETR